MAMSKRDDRCRNCGCERARRPFKRRDCCGKCFYLFQYLRAVERWDVSRPDTLKHISAMERRLSDNPDTSIRWMSGEDFAIFKASYIAQIKVALDLLRIREARRRGELRVDGLSIEHKLKDMLKLIQLRDRYERAASRFNGLASMLDHTFSPEQCRILYNLLDDIEEQTYGRVAESYKAFVAIYQNKRKDSVAFPRAAPSTARPPAVPADAERSGDFAYEPHDIVRRVQQGGRVSLLGGIVRVPKRLRGKDVAFRPTAHDGVFEVVLRREIITTVDVRAVGRDGRGIPAVQPPAIAPAYSFAGEDRSEMAPPHP
jgi:hypothetical protein